VTRRQLLTRIDEAWKLLQASYAGLTLSELLEEGVTGAWSVRDILAHVTTWEEEALRYLPLVATGGTPPRYSTTYGGIDAFNARMTEARRGLSLPAVFRQMDDTHRRLVELVQAAPDALITSETRFRHRLRLDTYSHYPAHAEAIRRWRARRAAVAVSA
jgi:PHD/YefM family antitoxin component YafN of YafNO toxin-antitoxin module